MQQHWVVSMSKLPEMHTLQWQKKYTLGYLFHRVDCMVIHTDYPHMGASPDAIAPDAANVVVVVLSK